MERVVEQVVFPEKFPRMQNVAAYARVSSGKDAMLHSLSAQVSYYSRMIQQHPGWKYCGVYADEAITGTKDSREQFQKLLERCRNGEIDLMDTLHHFLETISAVPQVLDSFDEELWRAMIEKVTVFHDGKMIFQFLDGTEIQG